MHRLFVAIRPPAGIREQLLDLMEGLAGARWQDDDQLHLTLRFIGEVNGRVADDVAAALGTVHHPSFEVALDGMGTFGSRGRMNALWAGVRPHEQLASLHRKIDQALIRAGLEPARRAYLLHITLARFGRDTPPVESFLARNASLTSPAFDVNRFWLYESHLGQSGASYEQVQVYHLSNH